ncbi:TerD family protein [Streptomyces sp. MUM 203J]|uniref:TerD family protein n=1 Tax=Streptomyces sp. MUM 203J TaxID=2791990 RepID=UPI0035ABFBDD
MSSPNNLNSLNKGSEKVEVDLKWDPNTGGGPVHDLDIIAAVYRTEDPFGDPVHLVHFDSRSPDGTIFLSRDSRDGRGFGVDESMTLELYRLSTVYARVVVGVAIQQGGGRVVFGDVARREVTVREGYQKLLTDDFGAVRESTAATVAEFSRDGSGAWRFRPCVYGFDADPPAFARLMGAERP